MSSNSTITLVHSHEIGNGTYEVKIFLGDKDPDDGYKLVETQKSYWDACKRAHDLALEHGCPVQVIEKGNRRRLYLPINIPNGSDA